MLSIRSFCFVGILATISACAPGTLEGSDETKDPPKKKNGVSKDPSKDEPSADNPLIKEACAGGLNAGPMGLRRLTRTEYANTARAFLKVELSKDLNFVADELIGGFAANAIATVDRKQVDDYAASAANLATDATKDLKAFTGCADDDRSCLSKSIADLGLQAFRRPMSAEQLKRYQSLFNDAAAASDNKTGMQLVIEALLQSPNYLYEVPRTQGNGDVARLDGYSTASRLSLYIWQSGPDDVLLNAAAQGDLDTTEGVREQVDRMLADDKAARALGDFHVQWLELSDLPDKEKDADAFAFWTPELIAAMQKEVVDFTDHVLNNGEGNFGELLTAPYSVIQNDDLAKVYGLSGGKDGVSMLDAKVRGGLLTQPGFLASHAHASENSWTERGKFVRESLFCQTIASPPANIDPTQLQANAPNRLKDATCSGCHQLMDPVGLGFEQFDPVGQYVPDADSKGTVIDAPDEKLNGAFDGVVALAEKISKSQDVANCVVLHWYRYALRRLEVDEDACSLARTQVSFAESGMDIKSLVAEVATSDSFLHINTAPQKN